MRRVRLTVEVGPAGELEQVLTVDYDDLLEAALLNHVPLQWTWNVEGVQMRMTARTDDDQDTPEAVG